jgi:hypothetical protein
MLWCLNQECSGPLKEINEEQGDCVDKNVWLFEYFIRRYIVVFFNFLPALLIVTLRGQRQAVRRSATCTV